MPIKKISAWDILASSFSWPMLLLKATGKSIARRWKKAGMVYPARPFHALPDFRNGTVNSSLSARSLTTWIFAAINVRQIPACSRPRTSTRLVVLSASAELACAGSAQQGPVLLRCGLSAWHSHSRLKLNLVDEVVQDGCPFAANFPAEVRIYIVRAIPQDRSFCTRMLMDFARYLRPSVQMSHLMSGSEVWPPPRRAALHQRGRSVGKPGVHTAAAAPTMANTSAEMKMRRQSACLRQAPPENATNTRNNIRKTQPRGTHHCLPTGHPRRDNFLSLIQARAIQHGDRAAISRFEMVAQRPRRHSGSPLFSAVMMSRCSQGSFGLSVARQHHGDGQRSSLPLNLNRPPQPRQAADVGNVAVKIIVALDRFHIFFPFQGSGMQEENVSETVRMRLGHARCGCAALSDSRARR